MKKILAVSWTFPPVVLPRALQVSRTLKSLREAGWQFSVLTVDPRSIRRTFKSDPVLGAEYAGLFPITAVPSPEDSLFFRAIWRLFPDLSLLPDPRSVWIPAALSAGRRLLAGGGFDGILSFAQPWSDHLIARRLSREFRLPWIAHFSDPWVDSPYYRLRGWAAAISKGMEEDVMRDASAVIFVSEQTRGLVMRKYPSEWAAKAHVIPHCYEPALILPSPEPPQSSDRALCVVYTGGFYGRRSPISLFEAIAKLKAETDLNNRLHVHLVGPGMEPYQRLIPELGLEGIVTAAPLVPYHESLKIAAQADVLLVIDAPSSDVSVFLPSKLVEYLAFQKPIMGITPLKGAAADLLRELECPLADPADVAGIAAVLRELLAQKEKGKLAVSPAFSQAAARYDIRATTRQYEFLLDNLFTPPLSE